LPVFYFDAIVALPLVVWTVFIPEGKSNFFTNIVSIRKKESAKK
jgi:hypothetical protein